MHNDPTTALDSPFLNPEAREDEPALRPVALEHITAEPVRSPVIAAAGSPLRAGDYSFQVLDAHKRPLAKAAWAVHQDGAMLHGQLDATGWARPPDPALSGFDGSKPFLLHVDGHVCSIVRGAVLLAGEPGVEYGGQFVDWSLADHADLATRAAFWQEYEKTRALHLPLDVFTFLQHDHLTRRPVRMLSREHQAVFEARPVAIRLGPLLRYVDAHRALVWLELETPGLVRVVYGRAQSQRELPGEKDEPADTVSRCGTTVRAGGRHYALVCLDRLDADCAYQYTVEVGPLPATGDIPTAQADFTDEVFPRSLPIDVRVTTNQTLVLASLRASRWLFFRSLPEKIDALRFAHGSCRKWPGDADEKGKAPGPDMLERFATDWLAHKNWAAWPQFFVHTGDQIYADDVGMRMGRAIAGHRFASVVPGPAPRGQGDVAQGAWAGRFADRYATLEKAGLPLPTDVEELKKLRPRATHDNEHDVDYAMKEALRARQQLGFYRNRSALKIDLNVTHMARRMHFKLRVLNGLLWNVPDHASQVPQVDKQRGLVAPQTYRLGGLPAKEFRVEHPSAGETDGIHAADFAEYAALYEQAWSTPNARRMLAHLPSFMIFDDHEVTDDWNADPGWLDIVHAKGDSFRYWPTTMTDALCAYWVYQGWGNLSPEAGARDPRTQILQRCMKSGRDALPELRRLVFDQALAPTAPKADFSRKLSWHFALPTDKVPFLVVDLRTDRDVYGTGGMTKERLGWIEHSLRQSKSPMAFLVLPVPFLMPDPMLFAFRHPWFTGRLAGSRSTEEFKRSSDIEHPAGNPVWDQIKAMLGRLQKSPSALKTIAIISGDIHFSCNLDGQLPESTSAPRLLQLVSSGLQQTISSSKQDKLAGAYKGWLNVIARSQGVDEHRGVRITLGGMHGPGSDLRNFLFSTSLAIVEAQAVPAGPQKTLVPLIVQTHWSGPKPGALVPFTFRHMTQTDGSAVMSLKDPGFAHPASPTDYPAAVGGIGRASELEELLREPGEGSDEMTDEALELQFEGDDEAEDEDTAFDRFSGRGWYEAEKGELDPGQSVLIDGQNVGSYADVAAWYAARRDVLLQHQRAFVKEKYQVPDGLDDLLTSATARSKSMGKLGAKPVSDAHIEVMLRWFDAYLDVMYHSDLKMEVIAADRFRATQAQLDKLKEQAAKLQPRLRDLQRSAFRNGSKGKLKELAETFSTYLDSTLVADSWVREAATRLDDIRVLGTTLRTQKALHGSTQPWHELMRATTNAKIDKLLNVANGLNKALAVWQIFDASLAVVSGGKTASDRASSGIALASTLASAGGTLLGASGFFSLYTNLYIGPMVGRILGQIDQLKDQISKGRNHPYMQLGRLDYVDWSLEPGGREMYEYMSTVMKASSANDLKPPPSAVAKYFSKYDDEFDAGTPMRHGVHITYADMSDKRVWAFNFRDDIWAMLYGALPTP